jgi:superfamily II DNA or RNA helicase
MITITIENIECKLSEAPSDDVVEQIREVLKYKNDADNPFVRKNSKFKVPEFKYLYHKGRKTFPTGLLFEVEAIFKQNKVEYSLNDKRPDYPIINPVTLATYKLRDYQQEAKNKALAAKNCTVKISTGGGKTAIMCAICGDLNGYKRVVLVRRQMLLSQTVEVFSRELGYEVGQVGAGVVNIKDVTIIMVPTAARAIDPKWRFQAEAEGDEDDETNLSEQQKQQIRDFVSSAECIITDECHMLGSDTAQLINNYASSARYRLAFSATPWRDDGKDILLTAVSGPRVVDLDASYLIERGFLVPPHIYFFQTPPVRIPYFAQGKYQDVYKEFIVENEDRNAMIIEKATEAYNRFEKVLILIQQVEHGKILQEALEADGVWVDYIKGSSTAVTRKEIIEAYKSRSRSVLIGTNGTLSEGIDLPEISVLINGSGGKSSAQYYQKIGRALRLCEDKTRAIIVDFLDDNIKFMRKHSRERIKIIKTESLYKLKIQGEKNG